jgi:hypothetical protein
MMSGAMTDILDKKRHWWREPMVWLIIALPLAAVIGGLITVWIAARGSDPLVAEDYYKQGLVIHQVLERDARAAALNLSAELRVDGGSLEVRLTGRLDAYPDRLTLNVIHPTRSEADRAITLSASDQGFYRAQLPDLDSGQRRLLLEPEDRAWRLTGRWTGPVSGPTLMRPAKPDSPPHP